MEHSQPVGRARSSPPGRGLAALRVAGVGAVALGAACVALRIDRARLDVPFTYSSDALLQAAWAKTLIEQPWIHTNPGLGAPFGQLYYDFPLFESLNFLFQKMLGWLGGSWAFVMNAYYLLTFPAAAMCAYGALVALGVSALPAAVAGVAYTLLPYHFYRGELHLFLSGYHFVPLAALVALWIARGDLPEAARTLRSRRFGLAAGVMLLTAGSGIYYAFFTAWFVIVAMVYATLRRRTWRPAAAGGPLLAILVLGGALNLAACVPYWQENGTTPVVHRTASNSMFWGFRLTSALLPMHDHRLGTLSRLRWAYTHSVQDVISHDDSASSLGGLASLGFLGLFVLPVLVRRPTRARETLAALGFLSVGGVLLATTGGLGQILATFVTPDIRCWERIVPFLGFFALAAVAIALDLVASRAPRGRGTLAVGAVALGVVAFLDQTSPRLVPDYDAAAAATASDRAFFGDVERALRPGAMVFQLPYVPFPEGARSDVPDYDLFRPYLSTTALRWSYGAIRTRFADAWIRSVAARPADRLVEALVLAGFDGIVVDRRGYPDAGAALDAALRPLTGAAVAESPDHRYVWYRLDGAASTLRSALGDDESSRRAAALLHPFYLEWQNGFYDLQGTRDQNLRWSAARSVLAVDNPRPSPTRARLTAEVCPARREPAALSVRSAAAGIDRTLSVDASCSPLELVTTLPPGRTFIYFATTAKAADAPADWRRLHFRLNDFRLAVDGVDDDVLENR